MHRILILPMVRLFGTILAGLLGLAFGSFLNVCATRWPEEESVVSPRSHCRSCGRTLAWYENIPLASWIALRGRCAGCKQWIGYRYPLVEFAVAATWALAAWQALPALYAPGLTSTSIFYACFLGVEKAIFCWLLIGMAVLDAENLWLPNRLTLGGAILGLPFAAVGFAFNRGRMGEAILYWCIGIVIAPGIILLTRWTYYAVRKRHGVGLGDAKLMLMLAVWLGLAHTLLAFVSGIALGTAFALVLLLIPDSRRDREAWALTRLPLGTFLCAGGIISAFWGTGLIDAYLRAAGF